VADDDSEVSVGTVEKIENDIKPFHVISVETHGAFFGEVVDKPLAKCLGRSLDIGESLAMISHCFLLDMIL
jgi:hypothetical protein